MGGLRGGVPAVRHARTDRLGVVRGPDGAAVPAPGVPVLARERPASVVDWARPRVPARRAGLGPARKPRPDARARGRLLLHPRTGQPVRASVSVGRLAAGAAPLRLVLAFSAL